MPKIGLIGGSGLYNMEGLTVNEKREIDTPFGKPSGPYMLGQIDGVDVVFLPRHGPGHFHLPTEVNVRANIWGMKKLGVEWIISVSAVGSLQEDIAPGKVVLVDQFIDRSHHRRRTFFGEGMAGHVSLADPVCETLRQYLLEATKATTDNFQDRGTYVNIEGPTFSTRAESNLFRSWKASVVGMTCYPEACLAREAEISYAVLAMATDWDCWHEEHDNVTVDTVVATLKANVKLSQEIVRKAIARVAAHEGAHPQADAMQHAVMTAEHLIPNATRHKLAPVTSKYYPPQEGEFEGEMPTVPEPASFSSSSSSSSGVDVQTIGIAAAVAMSALALAKSFNLV